MTEHKAPYNEAPTPENDQEEQSRISIPGDTCLTALKRLRDAGEIDDAGRDAIWWFFGHCRDRGMTLADAGRCIDRDPTTVHRLFMGRYGAGYANLIEQVTRYRKIADQRAKRRDIGYIETATWRKISAVCRSALYDSMPAYIYGASQIGKSAALLEYQRRNNHGQTRYVRMPAAPSLPLVMQYLADACYISTRHRIQEIRRRIMSAVDDRTLVIIDEVHQVMIGASDLTARKIIEFIREIYDRTGCGIVMAGTKVLRDEIVAGRQAMVYDQFRRRGMIELVLPAAPPRADLIQIAAAFGLPAPEPDTWEIIRDMLHESGLGKYIKYLQYAHGLSVNQKRPLSWDHFSQAYRSVRALSK